MDTPSVFGCVLRGGGGVQRSGVSCKPIWVSDGSFNHLNEATGALKEILLHCAKWGEPLDTHLRSLTHPGHRDTYIFRALMCCLMLQDWGIGQRFVLWMTPQNLMHPFISDCCVCVAWLDLPYLSKHRVSKVGWSIDLFALTYVPSVQLIFMTYYKRCPLQCFDHYASPPSIEPFSLPLSGQLLSTMSWTAEEPGRCMKTSPLHYCS